ncbi:hypothetical protein C482_10981 [Natrialba chahannaoensis JCM 10990]|uniref:Uncharacterized protein n=1 Tax=Natrialba chahannaoensis JCM 10990 TaxID=1227492 RepID=M0AKM3_9EURY|nr:hypothetical protein C482_10981 [Natrialba chahannaoensis JCM 10990]
MTIAIFAASYEPWVLESVPETMVLCRVPATAPVETRTRSVDDNGRLVTKSNVLEHPIQWWY